MATIPTIAQIKALDGRILAMLTPEESAVLDFYLTQGRWPEQGKRQHHWREAGGARRRGGKTELQERAEMKTYTIDLDDDEVLVALKRGEGYDDVHPELVSEDAISDRWPEYRTIHGDALRTAPVAAWAHEEDPERVISAAQKAQAEREGGASASSVRPYTVALR